MNEPTVSTPSTSTPPSAPQSGSTLRPVWTVTSALVATSVLGGLASPAQAQSASGPAPTHPDTTAEHQRKGDGAALRNLPPMRFDIPSGVIDTVLAAFERTTGLKVQTAEGLKHGLRSDGVTGELAPAAALEQILNGTGLTYGMLDHRTILVKAVNAQHQRLESMDIVGTASSKPTLSSNKYTEPLRDVSQTIVVVPQSVITSQGATSLRDVIRNVPGVTMNAGEGGSTPGDKFNVRGFSAANDMFVNGVRDVSGYSRDAYNLEQIEVSKGPNSSVSGRGSTGGSINMVTKTPNLHESRLATIALGSADQRRATIDINQPLAMLGEQSSAFRLNAVTTQAGVAGDEAIQNKNWGFAPSLTIGLNGPTQLALMYNRSIQNNLPAYGIESFAGVPKYDTRNFYGLRSVDREHVDANQFIVRVDHNVGGFAHITNQSTRGRAQSDRIVTSAVPAPSATNPDSARRGPKTHINDNTVWANQTNMTMSFSTGAFQHDIATGFEYTRENSRWGKHTITGTVPSISNLNAPTEDADFDPTITSTLTRAVRATTMGAYAFETLRAGKYIEINGGLRWDQYTPHYVDSASKATGFTPANSRAITGRAGLVVKPKETGSIYASYGTSFDPSNENLSADAVNANSDLPPEKSRSYEVGTKWDLFKQRLLSSFALFRTDKVNARVADPADASLQILAGKQRVQGGEASLTGNITPEWSVIGGYSYMTGKTIQSPSQAQINQPFTNVPKHTVNLWSTYELTKQFTVGGGARYMDKRLLRWSDTLQVFVPSYHTYDATASYQVNSTIGVQLNLYNLSDKLYYDAGRMWVPAAGRSVSVTTSMKF